MSNSFLWGVATSAHQVEGNNVHSDWWAWEKRTSGVVPSGAAANHYNLFKEDLLLSKQLGHTAQRISIEWSRIEPQQSRFNRQAVAHYRHVLQEMRSLGFKTFVTLHHFTNPKWFSEKGGWLRSDSPELFLLYAQYAVQQLGDLVDVWITINEPAVFASKSYLNGEWPPQHKSYRDMRRVLKNLARAHRLAYKAIHRYFPKTPVGIAKNMIAFLPYRRDHFGDRLIVDVYSNWYNWKFFKKTKNTHDFIGINYYTAYTKKFSFSWPFLSTVPWKGSTSDIGWPIRPEGLTQVLMQAKEYGLPIYILENGLADANDMHRPEFIRSHLRAIEKAQAQGANVKGYFHWSLLDNFEWSLGFGPRFGLVEVDYKTMKRTPRPSAYVYKAIIEQAGKR